MPLFFFPCRDQRERANRERGKKRALQAVFSFWGCIYLSPTAKRAKNGEKSRENGNRTRNAQRNTAHGAKISPYKPIKHHTPPTTPPTARTTRKRPKKGDRENAHGTPTAAGQERPRERAARIATERGRRTLSASPRAYAHTRGHKQ